MLAQHVIRTHTTNLPNPAKRECSQVGCHDLVDKGRCTAHAVRVEYRQTARQRGYDARWEKFRKWFLSKPENCVCKDCERVASVHVHHIKKLRDYPKLKCVESNCMGLCGVCHAVRTAIGE